MPKVIVFQHVPYEILGTMDQLFRDIRIRIKYVNFGRHPHSIPDIEGYDGLVILGGPMNVYQVNEHPHLLTEVELIQKAMHIGMPILGICLGAQLIAKAAGAIVKKNPSPEIGWYDVCPTALGCQDRLIGHFEKSEKIFQWHGDTFELPGNASLLAEGELCANQAFKLNDNIYGFQFHLEVDQHLIERWLSVPAHQDLLIPHQGGFDPEQIRAESSLYIDRSMILSQQVFSEFANMVGRGVPPVRLSSR